MPITWTGEVVCRGAYDMGMKWRIDSEESYQEAVGVMGSRTWRRKAL
jgi:hypothetical protein